MSKRTLAALIVAAFASASGTEFAVSSTAAAALPAASIPTIVKSHAYIQPVAWVYVKKKHGNRYKYKRKGYGYYYGGYWYARPWWRVGAVAVGPVYLPIYGPRYRYKRAGYGYYYKGYWYRKRWW